MVSVTPIPKKSKRVVKYYSNVRRRNRRNVHFTLQPPATRCNGVVVVHQIRRQVSSSVSFRPHQRHLVAVALKRVPRAHRKKKKNKTSGEVGRVASHVPIFLLFGLLSNEYSVSVDIISSCAYRSWGLRSSRFQGFIICLPPPLRDSGQ